MINGFEGEKYITKGENFSISCLLGKYLFNIWQKIRGKKINGTTCNFGF
jgi:hypothetical protein